MLLLFKSAPTELTRSPRASVRNEGSTWAPMNLTTDAQMSSWFSSIIPKFNKGHLRRVLELYPSPTKKDSPYANSLFAAQWSRMRDAYGDYAYISTSVYNAVAASNWESLGGKVFKYNFADTTTVANATLGVTRKLHPSTFMIQAESLSNFLSICRCLGQQLHHRRLGQLGAERPAHRLLHLL